MTRKKPRAMVVRAELVPQATHQPAPLRDRQWVQELLDDWLATIARSTLVVYRANFSDFARFSVGDPDDHAGALALLFSLGEAEAHKRVLGYKADMMKRPVWNSTKDRDNGVPPVRHGLAARTVNHRLASLRSVVRLARIGWLLDVSGTKVEAVRDTSGISRDDFLAMLKALKEDAAAASEAGNAMHLLRALRDTCVLRLWHDMGLRRASVQRLDLDDLDLRREMLRVHLKGRGEETKDKPVPGPTLAVLEAYLRVRGRGEGPLFYSFSNRASGQRLRSTSYNKLLARVMALAGVAAAHPHQFRHTAITRALDRGASVRDVQAFSDHRDVRTVFHYDDQRGVGARSVAELVAAEDEVDDGLTSDGTEVKKPAKIPRGKKVAKVAKISKRKTTK